MCFIYETENVTNSFIAKYSIAKFNNLKKSFVPSEYKFFVPARLSGQRGANFEKSTFSVKKIIYGATHSF